MSVKIVNDFYDFQKWMVLKIAKFPRKWFIYLNQN